MTLNKKLATIQTKFKSKKSRFNSFGKYYFRSAEDILEAIKPFVKELDVTVTINEELVDTAVLQSTATITDGTDTITATAVVGVDLEQKGMQMPQRYGSASSYGKKYALGNLFLIDDTQDSDATNNHGKSTKDVKPSLSVNTQAFTKATEYLKSGGDITAITKKYKVSPEALAKLKQAEVHGTTTSNKQTAQ
ncbi:ERF family protein [Escherichia coli]|uniref:ERF family protein n=1 Tax=Escherichia coli TaxID=562 RepID=UPI0006A5CC29|nr:ERF family protein [Escherichia coli]